MGRKQRLSSSSQPSGSHDSMTIIMATLLAQELKPEHKLPNEKLLVRPKSAFLKLLATVGAKGTVFTSQQILQFLIKYIEGLKLYDPVDPRMVYCEKDPLGVVFGVKMFTIKDAKKLIFANVDVVSGQRDKDKASVVQQGGLQQQDKQYYYTLQHSHWLTSGSASGSNVEPSAVASAADECDAPIKIVPSKPHTVGKRTRSDSMDSKSSKKRSVHSVSVSEDEKEIVVPWYAKKYPRDDVTSVSTDQHSVQDKATAVVANSSDDLWFLEEDQLEFEIESEISSESYRSVESSVDSALTEAIFEVEVEENESIFGDVDSDTDSIDTEISERDKWECNECNTTNPPIHGYCMGCWALRKGWLADEKRLTLMERLMSQRRSLSRSLSAPSDMRLPHESIRNNLLVSNDNCDGLEKGPSSSDDDKAKTNVDEEGEDEAGIGTRPKSPISSSDTVLLEDPESAPSTVRVLKGKQSRFSRREPTPVGSASNSRLEPGNSEFFSVGRHTPSDDGGIGKTSLCPVSTEEAPSVKKAVSPNDLCMLCESRTKNASIIHGKSGHQVCCYSCAKKLRRHGKPCPVCRRKIQHVIKNYLL
ncbi:protein Mdm4-like isoform X2 [Anneissia japonica]|nr:protein Mdm4-like isoform X2 [Anneissia japonica]